jgi:type IV pilus assembly protein PilB
MDNNQVIEIFVNRGMIDRSLAQDVLNEIEASGKEVGEVLADFEVISARDDIWPIIASELGADLVDLSNWSPPQELIDVLPAGMARLHGALPINAGPEGISVALVDPLNPQTLEDLRFALGREIILCVAPDYFVEKRIEEAYGGEMSAMEDLLGELDGVGANADDIEAEASSAPIIRFVDLVLYHAIKEQASDIHFEPFEKDFKIRYRVDGSLY